MNRILPIIGKFKHFKGDIYELLGEVKHSETKETMVLYVKENDTQLWVRPLHMFYDTVLVNGVEKPRFEKLGDPKARQSISP